MITRIDFDSLARQVLDVCHLKRWPLTWDHRGVYLHLEASELIEAVRGGRNDKIKTEAGDLLFTFIALLASSGVQFGDAVEALQHKINTLDPLGETIRHIEPRTPIKR